MNQKKKKQNNSRTNLSLPTVIPYTLFEASKVDFPPNHFKNYEEQPFVIPRRIKDPKIMKEQTHIQLNRGKKDNEITQLPIHKFSLKSKAPVHNTVPDFDVLEPITGHTMINSDSLRITVQYKPPKLQQLLKSTYEDNPGDKDEVQFDEQSIPVTIPINDDSIDFQKHVFHLFQSVIMPPQQTDDSRINIYRPNIRSSNFQHLPVPAIPSIVAMHIYNEKIAVFEYQRFQKRYMPQLLDVTYEKILQQEYTSRYLTRESQLDNASGEFIMIESSEENPITRPMIGMTSKLDVLNDQPTSSSKHPFDQRIPFTPISSKGLSPFLSRIPRDTYVLMYSNSVVTSALYPHPTQETDFLIAYSLPKSKHSIINRARIIKLPTKTYLSTPYEPKIMIPLPFPRNIQHHLNYFKKSPLPPAEELCRRRSIVEGLEKLKRLGVNFRTSVPSITKEIASRLEELSPEMRNAVRDYIRMLKNTPWYQSSMITRARMGSSKAYNYFVDEKTKNGSMISKLREALDQSFEDKLLFIQSGQNEEDVDFDLSMYQDDEEEDWEILFDALDEMDETEHGASLANSQANRSVNIDWNALGLGNIPKRKVAKVVEYSIVNGCAVANVRYERDPLIVKKLQSQKIIRRISSSDQLINEDGME